MANTKPRLFIGSSVEGLHIAYAAQQNLQHSAEVTVWDQGVFDLSVPALDSLLRVLHSSDFALFVFSPDDVVKMRGIENLAIRDNVIFELGLFVGRLSKERCFILMPDKATDVRIPTDLIGMTPGTYETGRSDNSFQAATGPACHTIRGIITTKGPCISEEDTSSSTLEVKVRNDANLIEKEKEKEEQKDTHQIDTSEGPKQETFWLDAFIEDKYDLCIELLEQRIEAETDEAELASYESWKGRCIFCEDKERGIDYLNGVIEKFPNNEDPFIHLIYGLREINEYEKCLQISDEGIRAVSDPYEIIMAKCTCLKDLDLLDEVETLLKQSLAKNPKNSRMALDLSDLYIKKDKFEEARDILEDSLKTNRRDKALLKKYASLLEDHFDMQQALVQYNRLLGLDPDNTEYLTLRANIYLQLDLNDLAMRDYKKANLSAEGKQAWILGNIGNLYKNRGLYHDAIDYLKKAIELDPESEYAHNRLSETIKRKDAEGKKLDLILKEANKTLIAYPQRKSNNGVDSDAAKPAAQVTP
jgi:tetratricopeptide (TPR) repeat protein